MVLKGSTFTLLFAVFLLEATADHEGLAECFSNVDCVDARLQLIVAEDDPSQGLKPLDPLEIDKIADVANGLDFVLSPAILTGLSDCKITGAELLSPNDLLVRLNMFCPRLVITGDYVSRGVLLETMPMDGDGKYKADNKDYEVTFDISLSFVTDADKIVLQIDKYGLEMDAKGGTVYELTNIFDGDKAMSDAVLRYSNEHSAMIAKQFEKTLFIPFFDELMSQVSKYWAKYLKCSEDSLKSCAFTN